MKTKWSVASINWLLLVLMLLSGTTYAADDDGVVLFHADGYPMEVARLLKRALPASFAVYGQHGINLDATYIAYSKGLFSSFEKARCVFVDSCNIGYDRDWVPSTASVVSRLTQRPTIGINPELGPDARIHHYVDPRTGELSIAAIVPAKEGDLVTAIYDRKTYTAAPLDKQFVVHRPDGTVQAIKKPQRLFTSDIAVKTTRGGWLEWPMPGTRRAVTRTVSTKNECAPNLSADTSIRNAFSTARNPRQKVVPLSQIESPTITPLSILPLRPPADEVPGFPKWAKVRKKVPYYCATGAGILEAATILGSAGHTLRQIDNGKPVSEVFTDSAKDIMFPGRHLLEEQADGSYALSKEVRQARHDNIDIWNHVFTDGGFGAYFGYVVVNMSNDVASTVDGLQYLGGRALETLSLPDDLPPGPLR